MSLAISFGDSADETSISGSIYFNAVTKYSKNLSGKVTEHPIEVGSYITDHFISQNPRYSLSGIISHVDFSNIPSMILLPKIDGTEPGDNVINNQEAPEAVVIQDMASSLERFIPGVVQQFLSKTRPQVIIDPTERLNYKMSIENFLEVIIKGLFYNEVRQRWENRMTPCVLYEMDGAVPVRPIGSLILTGIDIQETEDTGEDLFIDLSFEQVTFVTLERVAAPKPPKKSDTEKNTDGKKNKGTKNGTVNDPKNPPNDRATVAGEVAKGNSSIGGN